MIKISGTFKNEFVVEIDVNSFNEICEENMSYKQSDELISNAVYEKYGVVPDKIWVRGEEK